MRNYYLGGNEYDLAILIIFEVKGNEKLWKRNSIMKAFFLLFSGVNNGAGLYSKPAPLLLL
tara:strand:- start:179 stop:361 length:183 start_codon:yes stop_codon:yes gene_type:complete